MEKGSAQAHKFHSHKEKGHMATQPKDQSQGRGMSEDTIRRLIREEVQDIIAEEMQEVIRSFLQQEEEFIPEEYAGGYDYEYEYRPRERYGYSRRREFYPRGYDEDYYRRGRGGRRIERVRGVSHRFRRTRGLPTLGPTHPEEGRRMALRIEREEEPRAFSAKRFGNVDEETGLIIDKGGTIDRRTKEGRIATDDAKFSDEELQQMLDDAPRNKDGSVDLRTEQGRALRAAGYVDEDGWPVEEPEREGAPLTDEGDVLEDEEERDKRAKRAASRRQGRGR